jgi:hypothetical protein
MSRVRGVCLQRFLYTIIKERYQDKIKPNLYFIKTATFFRGMIKKNQTAQAAFENTLGVPAAGRAVGSLDGGTTSNSPRVNQPEREAVSSPQSEIQHKQNNQ